MHTITLPNTLKIGAGAKASLPDLLQQLGCQRPLIISDQTMVALGHVEKLQDYLADGPINTFTDTMAEPNDLSLLPALELAKNSQCDGLIALGGGSVIDSAKAIALLASHGGPIERYKAPDINTKASIPVIAIPTTAGTGSEVTAVTVITNSATGEKMLCMGPGLMPTAAIIDFEYTLSLPIRVAADTGIDALTHAIEAFVSQKRNSFSDQQAIAAMKLIAPNLSDACASPDRLEQKNLIAKESVMLGATLAGMAFSNASVALVHGMSRPLGVHFHIPHGMSNAMLLPKITEFSLSGDPIRYAQCAMHMGLVDDYHDTDNAHRALLSELTRLNQSLQVPTLAEYGVAKNTYIELIDTMVQQAIDSGSPANNPKLADKQQMAALYHQLW